MNKTSSKEQAAVAYSQLNPSTLLPTNFTPVVSTHLGEIKREGKRSRNSTDEI